MKRDRYNSWDHISGHTHVHKLWISSNLISLDLIVSQNAQNEKKKLNNQRQKTSWNLNSQSCDRYTCFARTKCIVIHWIVELCFVCYLYVSGLIYVFTVHVNPFFSGIYFERKTEMVQFCEFLFIVSLCSREIREQKPTNTRIVAKDLTETDALFTCWRTIQKMHTL